MKSRKKNLAVIYITASVLAAVGLVTCVNYAQQATNKGYSIGYYEGYSEGYESGNPESPNVGFPPYVEDYYFSYSTDVDDELALYWATASSAYYPESDGESFTTARVVQVGDGDTIVVDIDGINYRVRYIGIDAPVVGEPYSDEAKEQNTHLVGGKIVWLEKDVSERYHYGSLFRYIWVDNMLVNAELVRLGLAKAKAFYPNMKYQNYLELLQAQAQSKGLGIWQTDTTELRPQ